MVKPVCTDGSAPMQMSDRSFECGVVVHVYQLRRSG